MEAETHPLACLRLCVRVCVSNYDVIRVMCFVWDYSGRKFVGNVSPLEDLLQPLPPPTRPILKRVNGDCNAAPECRMGSGKPNAATDRFLDD